MASACAALISKLHGELATRRCWPEVVLPGRMVSGTPAGRRTTGRKTCPGQVLPQIGRHVALHSLHAAATADRAVCSPAGSGLHCEASRTCKRSRLLDHALQPCPSEKYDVAIDLTDLPPLFRTNLPTIPVEIPYIDITPRRFSPTPNFRVGLVSCGSEWDPRRSLPVQYFAGFDQIGGVALHILQRGSELLRRPSNFGMDSGNDDVYEAARTMAALDLMITIDSMPRSFGRCPGRSDMALAALGLRLAMDVGANGLPLVSRRAIISANNCRRLATSRRTSAT